MPLVAPLEEGRQTHADARLSALHFLPASTGEQISVYIGRFRNTFGLKNKNKTPPFDYRFVSSLRATGEEERRIQLASFHCF